MSVLIKPIVTEKMTSLNDKGIFGFVVNRGANKVEIKKAVEEMYGVTVQSVNTMNYKGKPKSRNTKAKIVTGRTPAFKKAVVQLSDGEFIDFYNSI